MEVVAEKPNKKYTVRQPRGLSSKYEKRMKEQEIEKLRIEDEKTRAEILNAIEVCIFVFVKKSFL